MRVALASILVVLAGCSSSSPVAASLTAPPPLTQTGSYSAATAPGATPGVMTGCPWWAPAFCGDHCCYSGDLCAGDGQCQTTGLSKTCPAAQPVLCGTTCNPPGTSCDEVPASGSPFPESCPVDDGGRSSGYCARLVGDGGALDAGALSDCGDGSFCAGGLSCFGLSCSRFGCARSGGTTPAPNAAAICDVGGGGGGPSEGYDCTYCSSPICCDGTCQSDGSCVPAKHPLRPGVPFAACPAAFPQSCGALTCCASGASCGGAGCGCPASAPVEGADGECCAVGAQWAARGSCLSCGDADFPVLCGAAGCCAKGASCINGACACADDTIACGDGCCPAGTACLDDGGCESCPADHPVLCGTNCCAAGQQCLDCPGSDQPVCGDSCPSDSASVSCDGDDVDATCPDGSHQCCSPNQVCCHDSANGGAIGCEFQGFCE